MNTLRQAATLLADYARAHDALIEQIDVVLCEDGETIAFYSWSENDDGTIALVSLPMTIKRESELLEDEWREAFHGLLPSDVLATRAPA